ncbi:MAG: hypothetical protein HY688_05265 [Chloroflexi bacterium]|nr:hypothetical protein [Chloroflexota bacterium]
MAPLGNILAREIDLALGKFFPQQVRTRDQVLFGYGLFFALGQPSRAMRMTGPGSESLPPALRRGLEGYLDDLAQVSLLSGVNLFTGESIRTEGYSEPRKYHQDSLDSWGAKLAPLDPEARERRTYGSVMDDIWKPLMAALECHGLTEAEFEALGEKNWRHFIDLLPSQRAQIQLLRQWGRNPQLRAKSTDLSDWGTLGPAVMYCDIVVTEKLFADLIQRDEFKTRARVITKLTDLPLAMVA